MDTKRNIMSRRQKCTKNILPILRQTLIICGLDELFLIILLKRIKTVKYMMWLPLLILKVMLVVYQGNSFFKLH